MLTFNQVNNNCVNYNKLDTEGNNAESTWTKQKGVAVDMSFLGRVIDRLTGVRAVWESSLKKNLWIPVTTCIQLAVSITCYISLNVRVHRL